MYISFLESMTLSKISVLIWLQKTNKQILSFGKVIRAITVSRDFYVTIHNNFNSIYAVGLETQIKEINPILFGK